MRFETALNILWVCLAVAAFGVLVSSELLYRSRSTRAERGSRMLSLVLAIIFLFPCVSASDDLLSFHNLQFTLETRGEVGSPLPHSSTNNDKPNTHLARLFEALQNFQIPAHYFLLLTLCFLGLVISLDRVTCRRCFHSRSGRDPPVALISFN